MQNQHSKFITLFLIFLGFFLVIPAASAGSRAAEQKITILYGNDIRGELEPCG